VERCYAVGMRAHQVNVWPSKELLWGAPTRPGWKQVIYFSDGILDRISTCCRKRRAYGTRIHPDARPSACTSRDPSLAERIVAGVSTLRVRGFGATGAAALPTSYLTAGLSTKAGRAGCWLAALAAGLRGQLATSSIRRRHRPVCGELNPAKPPTQPEPGRGRCGALVLGPSRRSAWTPVVALCAGGGMSARLAAAQRWLIEALINGAAIGERLGSLSASPRNFRA